MQDKPLYAEDRDDLEFALERLEEIIGRNESASRYIGLITLIHLLISPLFLFIRLWLPHSGLVSFEQLMVMGCSAGLEIFIVIGAILLLVRFDVRIKRGNAIYQEISHELEWKVIREGDEENPSQKTGDPPKFKTRILLREFVRSTRFPLVNSNHGVTIYAIVNSALFPLNLIILFLSIGRIPGL